MWCPGTPYPLWRSCQVGWYDLWCWHHHRWGRQPWGVPCICPKGPTSFTNILHCTSQMVPPVSLDDTSFICDAICILWGSITGPWLYCYPSNGHFETFTKSFWIRNHYEDVLGVVCVIVSIRVVVVLETKLMVQFSFESVKDPVRVIVPVQGGPDMLLFLSQ